MRRLEAEGWAETPAWIWDELMDPFEASALAAMAAKRERDGKAKGKPKPEEAADG